MVSASCGRFPSEFSRPQRSESIREKMAAKQLPHLNISLPNELKVKHLRLAKCGVPKTAALIPEDKKAREAVGIQRAFRVNSMNM